MANGQDQKIFNSIQILNELLSGPKSRNYLSKKLNLQPSTVTYSINRLKKMDIVKGSLVVSKDNLNRGRKSTELMLNPKAGVIFGVDLLVDSFTLQILHIDKSVFTIVKEKFDDVIITASKGSGERFIQCINYILSIAEAKCANIKCFGGCISVAGIVDANKDTLVKSLTHGIENICVKQCFEDRAYPIFLENDANCAAFKYRVNEKDSFLYSLVRLYDNLILPFDAPLLGVGIGIIINGTIYVGWDAKAGEFSNFVYQNGKQNRQLDFPNDVLNGLKDSPKNLNLFLNDYLDKLLFTNALLNPRTIYLGGEGQQLKDKIIELLLLRYPEKNVSDVINKMCFTFLEDTEDDVAIGACYLVLNLLFKNRVLSSVSSNDGIYFSALEEMLRT